MAYIIHQYTHHLLEFSQSLPLSNPEAITQFLDKSFYSGLASSDAEETFIDINRFLQLAQLIAELSCNSLLGLEFGLALDISKHGFLGYAAKSAETAKEAILVDCELLHTRITAFNMELIQLTPTQSAVRFSPNNFYGPQEVMMFEILCGTFCTMSKQVLNLPAPPFEIHSAYAANDNPTNYELKTQCKWLFDQPHSQFLIPHLLLNTPIPTVDPSLKALARKECMRLIASLPKSKAYAVLVHKIIRSTLGQNESIDDIANKLHVSSRTLKRKLKDEGTTYSDINKEVRQEAATNYLLRSTRTVEDIALEIGFSSAANFVSTFKRWTGESPSQYRKIRRIR